MVKPIIAAALIAITATPVVANDHAWQVGNDAMHVYYSDLDLNSAVGRAQLLARIERVADRLCRDRTDRRDCVNDTVAQTAHLARATALRLALSERTAIRLAAR